MKSWWITFDDGTKGCCSGESDYDAKIIAEHVAGKKVKDCKSLPYPADPTIWQYDHPKNGKCPHFCHSPNQCAGNGSCPQSYSCTE